MTHSLASYTGTRHPRGQVGCWPARGIVPLLIIAVFGTASSAAGQCDSAQPYGPPTPPPSDSEPPDAPAPETGTGNRGPGAPAIPTGTEGGGSESRTGPDADSLGGVRSDPTWWPLWWEHNRFPYLELPATYERLFPATLGSDAAGSDPYLRSRRGLSRRTIEAQIVPALLTALEAAGDNELRRQLLLALGRLGPGASDTAAVGGEGEGEGEGQAATRGALQLRAVFESHLNESSAAVSEAAALALGLIASHDAALLLVDLTHDRARARERCGRRAVPVRLRAVAAYGLGVCASRSRNTELVRFVAHELSHLLDGLEPQSLPDLEAACVAALGVLPLAGGGALSGSDVGRKRAGRRVTASASREELAAFLLGELARGRKRAHARRVHAPTALARLADGAHEESRERVIAKLIELALPQTKEATAVRQSAVLALGQLADASAQASSVEVRAALMSCVGRGDLGVRALALVALGECAGRGLDREGAGAGVREVESFLVRHLVRGKSRLEPWAGLGLGLLGRRLHGAQQRLGQVAADALLERLTDSGAPHDGSAYATAVALLRDHRGRSAVEHKLERFHDPLAQGNVALALGLMDSDRSRELLTSTMEDALHQPRLLVDSALARAMIGDASVVDGLVEMLADCDCSASYSGVCRALGLVGDQRAVGPLLGLLLEAELPARQRAPIAEAIGWLGDPEPDPFDVIYSVGANYLAGPATLTHPQGYGVLDVY